MTSTYQKIEKYIGFNLDATIANEIQLIHVPSYRGCDYCEYVVKECPKNNRYEPDDKTRRPDGTNHVAINQLFCQFNRIIIDGVTYDRHRKEKPSIFESCEMMTPGFINRHRGSRCNGCGVPMGFVHHIGCEHDRCPKCGYGFEKCVCSKTYAVENDCVEKHFEISYKDYIVRHKEYNSDAETTYRLHIPRVESVHSCAQCPHYRSPQPYTRNEMVFGIINSVYCQFNWVKIGGTMYKRNRNSMYDVLRHDILRDEARCYDCGVPAGFIHHVGCWFDTCPKCHSRMNTCDCSKEIIFRVDSDYI